MFKWAIKAGFVWALCATAASSQPLISTRGETDFSARKNAFLIAIPLLHTYGWGTELQYLRTIEERYGWNVSLSFASYKNRDETRIASFFSDQGGRDFIFDKINYAYIMGFTVGGQYELIPRKEFTRVRVLAGLGVGPALAILKPYLIEEGIPDNFGFLIPVATVYRNDISYNEIIGQADYFQGFDQLSTQVGIKIRGDLSVDLSGSSQFVRIVRVGVQADIFGKEVPIMLNTPNQSTFFGGHIALMLGNAW